MEIHDIDEKLLDYLFETLPPDEQEKVRAWISASKENERYFYKFQLSHRYLLWGSKLGILEKDYSYLRRRIKKRNLVHVFSRVAVVLLVLIGGSLFFWFNVETVNKFEEQNEFYGIKPGKNQAILYMASGETVGLSDSLWQYQEEDGTMLKIEKGRGLVYVADSTNNEKELKNRMVVPRGGEYLLELDDGTKVWLNSASEIIYPTRFSGSERVVQVKGEAYFDVAKRDSSAFIVRLGKLDVKVYGTQFNVNTHDDKIIETVLVEGNVSVLTAKKEIQLLPNQKAVYDIENGSVSLETVDVTPYVAWKDGNFVFKNQNMEEIMTKLSLWYDVDVFYANESVKNVRLSGDMIRYKDIEDLLYFFEQISDVKFQISGRTIVVK